MFPDRRDRRHLQQRYDLGFEQIPRFVKRRWPIRLDAQAEWTNCAGDISAIAGSFAGHPCRDAR